MLPEDGAGPASLPSHSERSSVPGACWASPNPRAESQVASWEKPQALETISPCWAMRQEQQGAGTRWVPTGSEPQGASATAVPLYQGVPG